jgi:hypothetical protein
MNVSPGFIKSVFRATYSHLAVLGFEKQKPGLLTIRITEDVLGWLGLNKAVRGQAGGLEINPVVGVRSQPVEKLVADLSGTPFDKFVPATLAGNIGYMMPANKYRPYNFSTSTPLETVVKELVDDLRRYGLPFIRNHTEMVALVKGLHTSRFAIRFMADYRIPAGLFLLGQLDEAEAYLKAKLADLGDRRDPAALRYKVFAATFAETRLRSK